MQNCRGRIHSTRVLAALAALGLAVSLFAAPESTITQLAPLPGYGQSEANAVNASGWAAGMSYNSDQTTSNLRATLWPPNGGVPVNLGTAGGFQQSRALDLNDSGQVVGYLQSTGNSTRRGFLSTPGRRRRTMQVLKPLRRYSASAAYGINGDGLAVGYSAIPGGGGTIATIWNGTRPRALAPLSGYSASEARAINAAGVAAGDSVTPGNLGYRPTLWSAAGQPVELLLPPGYSGGFCNDINDQAQVVGECFASNNIYTRIGVVWSGAGVTGLAPLPGYSSCTALSISPTGQVVGVSHPVDLGSFRATLWAGGGPQDVGTLPGFSAAFATGINALGQIAGRSFSPGGTTTRGFLASP